MDGTLGLSCTENLPEKQYKNNDLKYTVTRCQLVDFNRF